MLTCTGDLAIGLKMKQSLLAPDSPRPLGVTMRRGRDPFCNSSHISATDSLYPPPQSSTLSPVGQKTFTQQSHMDVLLFKRVISYWCKTEHFYRILCVIMNDTFLAWKLYLPTLAHIKYAKSIKFYFYTCTFIHLTLYKLIVEYNKNQLNKSSFLITRGPWATSLTLENNRVKHIWIYNNIDLEKKKKY